MSQTSSKRITVEEAIKKGYEKLTPSSWITKDSKTMPDFFTLTPDPNREGWENVEYYRDPHKFNKQLDESKNKVGWVYILSNKDHPNMLKIGHTRISVSGRIKQLNGTSTVGDGWKEEAKFICLDSYALEQEIHKTLNEFRVQNDREFFNISLEDAIMTVKHHLKSYTYF